MQEINAIVLSDKLPPNITSFFTKILNDICEDEAQGIVVAYVAKNGDPRGRLLHKLRSRCTFPRLFVLLVLSYGYLRKVLVFFSA